MLTRNEITALNLSPTKKDFVQIWNELLEVAGKLSSRWDPTSTNESDPGIVILKALTGIADKLNYNIDKNILEAFMPTAAQEESMRKLCEMLGYNVKYYQSAKTSVTIKCLSNAVAELTPTGKLSIPKFTTLSNNDRDVNYFTINPITVYLSGRTPTITVDCMEGQCVQYKNINDNAVITASQISTDNRLYLPEYRIAENGIFVYNVIVSTDGTLIDGTAWEKVGNLNTQSKGTRAFKFGFDSYANRPYIEFPDDFSELFDDGIFVYYTRTNGINGNISAHTLTQINPPSTEDWQAISASTISVDNMFAATTGANIETIDQAYHNFKKTIGTFDTLITCRDYMNKIYSMVDSQFGRPYVSNILATDIRDDINRSIVICSCDDAGIFYKEQPLLDKAIEDVAAEATVTKPVFNETDKTWRLGTTHGMKLTKSNFITSDNSAEFDIKANGVVSELAGDDFWQITQNDKIFTTNLCSREHILSSTAKNLIDHFDIVLYPFKSYNKINSNNNSIAISSIYNKAFEYSRANLPAILGELEDEQLHTIAHNFVSPKKGDITSINNYLRLNAIIATTEKVLPEECRDIIANIKMCLANAFNLRELDFGEEIPFDAIVEIIEKADTRIKVVSLNEPALYTTFSVLTEDSLDSKVTEYAVASKWLSNDMVDSVSNLSKDNFNTVEARQIYNKLALRNVLAGRVALFNYNTTFSNSFSETIYRETDEVTDEDSIHDLINAGLAEPSRDNPYTVFTDGANIYTGTYSEDADGNGTCVYSKSSPPEYLKYPVIDNISKLPISNDDNSTTTDNGSDTEDDESLDLVITDIQGSCEMPTGEDNSVADVSLVPGERIEFRAPNYLVETTYPAYVNYYLNLITDIAPTTDNEGQETDDTATDLSGLNQDSATSGGTTSTTSSNTSTNTPQPAQAMSIYDILNFDYGSWTDTTQNIYWQKALNYFTNNHASAVKTFTITQTVTPYDNTDGQKSTVTVDNNAQGKTEVNITEILAKSGCIKLTNNNRKARLAYVDKPKTAAAIDASAFGMDGPVATNPFINKMRMITEIQDNIDEMLRKNKENLPKEPWTISLDFCYVPFEPATYDAWVAFGEYIEQSGKTEFNFAPIKRTLADGNSPFWRAFGTGYLPGEGVTADGAKLLRFDRSCFGLLPVDNLLAGLYLVNFAGKDLPVGVVKNNDLYQLREGEYLVISYTPSSETGDTSTVAPTVKVYSAGTYIRPSGFDEGLVDSKAYARAGHTPIKTVLAEIDSVKETLGVFSIGASAQIEICIPAQLILNKDSFGENKGIYLAKNFDSLDSVLELGLEGVPGDIATTRKYVLGDGEYIFYTDANFNEFGYFSSGTEVVLEGRVALPSKTSAAVDVTTLLSALSSNSSFKEVFDWTFLALSYPGDAIIFNEYRYVSLGGGDTANYINVDATAEDSKITSDRWSTVSGAKYTFADGTVKELPTVNTIGSSGNGWQVSCKFDLTANPTSDQTLRYVPGKISTGLTVNAAKKDGSGKVSRTISLAPAQAMNKSKIASNAPTKQLNFKLNAIDYGSASTTSTSIDTAYTTSDKSEGLKLKVFVKNSPVVVKTVHDKAIPYDVGQSVLSWSGEPIAEKASTALWNSVSMRDIATDTAYDKALKLSVIITPNTYGIVSFYVKYDTEYNANIHKTWLDFLPGTSRDAVSVINVTDGVAETLRIVSENESINRLELLPGINCVRFDKTCDIFLKTSSDIDGTVFFDDFKLVTCQQVEYSTKLSSEDGSENSITYLKPTKGLNLAQIDYLTSSPVSNVISSQTQEQLKSATLDTAKVNLQKCEADLNSELSIHSQVFLSALSKIDLICADLNRLKAEREAEIEKAESGSDNGSSNLLQLFNCCNTLYLDIETESTLLSNFSSARVDVEDKLAAILEQFSSPEDIKTQLLEELQNILAKISENITYSSAAELISSFETLYIYGMDRLNTEPKLDASFYEIMLTALNELKTTIQLKYVSNFNNKIVDLLSKLETVVDTSETDSLSAVRAQLDALITSVSTDTSDVSESGTDTSILDSVKNAINTLVNNLVDQKSEDVLSVINQLEHVITNRTDFISKLKTAFFGEDYEGSIVDQISKTNINNVNITKIISLTHFEESLIEIWPNLLKELVELTIAANLRTAITDSLYDIDISIIQENLHLQNIFEYDSILSLVSKIQTKAHEGNKQAVIFDTIANVMQSAGLDIDSDEIESFVYDRVGSDYHKFDTLLSLITKLSELIADAETTVLEKRVKKSRLITAIKTELTKLIDSDKELLAIIESILYKNIVSAQELSEESSYIYFLIDEIKTRIRNLSDESSLKDDLEYIATDVNNIAIAIEKLVSKDFENFKDCWPKVDDSPNSLDYLGNSDSYWYKNTEMIIEKAEDLVDASYAIKAVADIKNKVTDISSIGVMSDDTVTITLYDGRYDSWEENLAVNVKDILCTLVNDMYKLNSVDNIVMDDTAVSLIEIENQLLHDILEIDTGRDFLYTIIPENHFALEFGNNKLYGTLMNPKMNYDLNNVNNNFVVSKIDIDYLDTGIQIATSSKLG